MARSNKTQTNPHSAKSPTARVKNHSTSKDSGNTPAKRAWAEALFANERSYVLGYN